MQLLLSAALLVSGAHARALHVQALHATQSALALPMPCVLSGRLVVGPKLSRSTDSGTLMLSVAAAAAASTAAATVPPQRCRRAAAAAGARARAAWRPAGAEGRQCWADERSCTEWSAISCTCHCWCFAAARRRERAAKQEFLAHKCDGDSGGASGPMQALEPCRQR